MPGALARKAGRPGSAGPLNITVRPVHMVHVTGELHFSYSGPGLQETSAVPASPLKS